MNQIKGLPELIFLCGFMGAGKSTIAEKLAEKLDRPFLDADHEIERRSGETINQIFEQEGESSFRNLERKVILDLIKTFEGVIALGGGALHNQHLVDHIKLNGLLIFIETPFSVILRRISENKERPLLLNPDGTFKKEQTLKKEMTELYHKRLKFYRQAEITLQTEHYSTVEQSVEALVKKIRYHVSHY